MQTYVIFGFSHHLGLLLSNTDLVSSLKGFSLFLEGNNTSTGRTSNSSGITKFCTALGLREHFFFVSGAKDFLPVLVLPSTISSRQQHDFSMVFLESSEGGELLWWSISLSQRPGFSALVVISGELLCRTDLGMVTGFSGDLGLFGVPEEHLRQ